MTMAIEEDISELITSGLVENITEEYLRGINNSAEFDALRDYFDSGEFNISGDDFDQYILADKVYRYGSPICVVFGVIFNSLAMFTLLQKELRSKTSSVYLITLTMVDLMIILVGPLADWIYYTTDVYPFKESVNSCKTLTFLYYYLNQLSSWILVCITVERLIFVYAPFRAKIICTMKSTFATIISVTLTLTCLNLHFFWTQDLLDGTKCSYKKEYSFFGYDIYTWVDLVMVAGIPFVIMFISNILIIVKLSCHHGANSNNTAKYTGLSVMLVTTNVTFVILTLPLAVYNAVKTIKVNRLTESILYLLDDLNHVVNFLLYCIAGPQFRTVFKNIFLRRNKVMHVSTGSQDFYQPLK